MKIFHDHSYVSQAEREFISRGYACESFYSLRFSFIYTDEQQAENHAYAEAVGTESDAWRVHVAASARRRSEHMVQRVTTCGDYYKALNIISEYVETELSDNTQPKKSHEKKGNDAHER